MLDMGWVCHTSYFKALKLSRYTFVSKECIFCITLYKIAMTIYSNEVIIYCSCCKCNHRAFQAMLNVVNNFANNYIVYKFRIIKFKTLIWITNHL